MPNIKCENNVSNYKIRITFFEVSIMSGQGLTDLTCSFANDDMYVCNINF